MALLMMMCIVIPSYTLAFARIYRDFEPDNALIKVTIPETAPAIVPETVSETVLEAVSETANALCLDPALMQQSEKIRKWERTRTINVGL